MQVLTKKDPIAGILHELHHFLPAQAPLKDFIHHNTLHAFQDLPFHEGIHRASRLFGYVVYLTLNEYRTLFREGKISESTLDRILIREKGEPGLAVWKKKLLQDPWKMDHPTRVGKLRSHWKTLYQVDMDALVHPILFRILCSFLDQGISMWDFPIYQKSFLAAMRDLERHSFVSFFKGKRARKLLLESSGELEPLLRLLVGKNEALFEHYVFDQQFAHQGWSGMVGTVEAFPQTLLDKKKITLRELIVFECLLEIDALDTQLGEDWKPLDQKIQNEPEKLFGPTPSTDESEVFRLWQEAYEWSYYDQVLKGLASQMPHSAESGPEVPFQALFCIDDRCCSIRRYLEEAAPGCQTYGTPGFFGVEFFFQPEGGKFVTKHCPAPMTPGYVIKEVGSQGTKHKRDVHMTKNSHSLFRGWLISQSLGFWSALRLFVNIFRPTMTPATAHSFHHMDRGATLTIERDPSKPEENGLKVGFTVEEMAIRVENLLRSIGLVRHFAPLVYVIGHGSSSVNNTHYAGYDCGACSGRPGSVNARVLCYMANHPKVRTLLASKGIEIPEGTQFVGGLHDTCRDEFQFYDEEALNPENAARHLGHLPAMEQALHLNAKERSRRLELVNTLKKPASIHEKVKLRSVSLFEPRPELNHATNCLCIIGRRHLTEKVFLDRRAFLNSYDYRVDPEGAYLLPILRAAAPVCGGINLEYYFSRVDNQKLGAGTKLPHNVMGLIGVANGIDGDLRPGLPRQMIEVHDPLRLLLVVEHYPEVILRTLDKTPETLAWFQKEWIHLVAIHPETRELLRFRDDDFHPYTPECPPLPVVQQVAALVESSEDNLPVHLLA